MSLILKQEPANTIATPPAGKSTLFVDDNSVMSVKNPAGTVTTFPTVQGSNTQVFFNDEGAINGSANLSFVKTTNTLTLTNGNVVATGVKTDNLYYANGSPWDLQQPAGSNNQLQYNDDGSFGASANLTFNGTSLNTTANLNVTGNAYISGNLTVDGNVVYVNVESLSVEDPLISLGGGPNGNALTSNNGYDRGLILHNYTTQAVDAFMGWDTSNAEFSFASNVSVAGEVVTINTLGNIRANRVAGTLSTAAQPNITSVGTLTGLLIGATSLQADFPNAKAIISQDNSGQTHSENIGVVGEAVADSGNTSTWGIGVLGEARANGATKATGVQGGGYVTNSADTGAAVGVRGYSTQTHSGGYNIGVLGNASGSGLGSYAFYVQSGNIGSIETTTNWELIDDEAAALTFSSTGKANIFGIETTDGAEGIYTQGYLNVSGNAAVGGIKTNNYYYANGSPVDFQQAGGSNTQIQFNDADAFGGSAAFTFNNTSNTVQIGGVLSVVGNANIGNIGTGGLVTATGNIGGGNLVTGGVVTATGNVTGGNLTTAGAISATGNANVGNLGTTGVFATTVSATGNANIGNIGTGGLITATGNIGGGNINTGGVVSATGNIIGGNLTTTGTANVGNLKVTGNVTGPLLPDANVTYDLGSDTQRWKDLYLANTTIYLGGANIRANGTSITMSGNTTAANLITSGILSVGGNANIGNIGTGGLITATGNLNAGNLITGGIVSATGNGTFGNVSATTFTGTLNGAATTAGTVTTAAQPNITSVGTLTSVSVSGNANIGNIGTGGLITATGNIGGGNINTGGVISATGNANVGNLGTTGVFATTVSATGNANVGNLGTAGLITATGNITGGNIIGTLLTGTLTTAAQPNITSVGTLTSVSVSGNANVGNIGAAAGVFTTVAGTLTTAAQPNVTSVGTLSSLAVTGNISAGNVSATTFTGALSGAATSATTAGTVTTAAQPNITSVGTLSSLAVTGNVAAGNLTTTGVLSVTGTGVSSIAGNLDMTSNTIINLASPTNPTDAATKQYVDDVAQGLHTHDSCNAATDSTLATISGGTVTYSNGTDGVGATLTTTGSYTTIDGVTLSNGMRILVKNEANTAHNGIYDRTSSTVLTRSSDFDTPTEMAGGDFTFVNAGTLYDNTGWVMPDPVPTVGTSPVVWVQFSGAGTYTAGTGLTLTGSVFSVNASQTQVTSVGTLGSLAVTGNISAGNVSATTFTGALSGAATSATTAGTVTTAAQPNITSVGTLTSLAVTGNISAGNVSATTFTGALSGAATTAGTVTTAAQPNITSVGTLTTLGVNGTVTAVAFTANTGVFTGNGSGLSAIAGANVTGAVAFATTANAVAGANVSGAVAFATTANAVAGANVSGTVSAATTAGTVTTAAQGNITSVGTLTSLAVTGNISAGNVSATTFTGALSGAATSATTAGTVTTAAQGNITSVGTLTGLGVNGTITAVNITANTGVFAGSGANLTTLNGSNISTGTIAQARLANSSLTVNGTAISLGGSGTITATATNALTIGTGLGGTSYNGSTGVTITNTGVTSLVAGTNIAISGGTGAVTVSVTGTVPTATTAGTVTTAAQPNITSVSGSFTSLTFANAQSLTGNNFTLSTGANTNAGTITGTWTLSAGSKLNATYADLAEKYTADADYEPGTVVLFGGEHEVTLSTEADSFRVAGVVTTNPAYVMNNGCEGEYVATLALQGRVPVKVKGPIFKGDLLVSSANGHASANNIARAGTIIGKSLENFTGESGVIEVAVGRF